MTLSSISNLLPFWYVNAIILLSNSVLRVPQNIKLLGSTFNKEAQDSLGVKVYNTSDYCWYWLSTKIHWTKTTSTTSRIGTFSTFFVFSINCIVLPLDIWYYDIHWYPSRYCGPSISSGVCSSSLYPPFVLNTNLLLVLLM